MRIRDVGLLLLILAAPVAAAQPAGFSGTWVLDPARSLLWVNGSPDIRMAIADQPGRVTVGVRTDGRERTYACAPDAKPCREVTASGDVYERTLRRDRALMLTWSITMTRKADQASLAYSERWTLSDEGRTLTVRTVYPGGREVVKVFARSSGDGAKDRSRR